MSIDDTAGGDRDDQFAAEELDASRTGEDPFEPSDAPTYPPERPLGVEDPTDDDLVTDSVASRARRELPDFDDATGPRTSAIAAAARIDDLDEARPPLRLVGDGDEGPEDLFDDEKDLVARAVVSDPEDLSAEEAALHLE